MQKNDIFIIVSAPSGGGKTTIIQRLISIDEKLEFVVSATTREKRDGEVEGRSYYFLSPGEFKHLIDNDSLIEWSLVHQNYYGISKKEFDRIRSLERIPIFDVDVQGAVKLKQILDNAVFIFIIPPSFRVLRERLEKRGTDSRKSIEIRLQNAKKELKKIGIFDYIVVNNDIDTAAADLHSIIRAESCRNKTTADKLMKILEE